ncbi:MAG: hypothetical protein ACQER9_00300 [Nanobdellota archaeon]
MNLELKQGGKFSSPAPFFQVDSPQQLNQLRCNQRNYLLNQRRKGEAFTIDQYVDAMLGVSLGDLITSVLVTPIRISQKDFNGLTVLLPDGMKKERYVFSPDVQAIKREQDDYGHIGKSNIERTRLTGSFFDRFLAKISTNVIQFPFYKVGKNALQYSFNVAERNWNGIVNKLDDGNNYDVKLNAENSGLEVNLKVTEGDIDTAKIKQKAKCRLSVICPYEIDFELDLPFSGTHSGYISVAGNGFSLGEKGITCISVGNYSGPAANNYKAVCSERAKIIRQLEGSYVDLEATLGNLTQPKTEPVKLYNCGAAIDLGPLALRDKD